MRVYSNIKQSRYLLALVLSVLFSHSLMATTFNVNSILDSGPGSLRQAILDANIDPTATAVSPHQISFDNLLANSTIILLEALPPIDNHITIDATTHAGYTGTPVININGTSVTRNLGTYLDGSGGIFRFESIGFKRKVTGIKIFDSSTASGNLCIPFLLKNTDLVEISKNVVNHCLSISFSNVSNSDIHHNHIDGSFISVWGTGNMTNTKIRDNIMANSVGGPGMLLKGCSNLTIENNEIYSGAESYGIYLVTENTFGESRNNIIKSNTIHSVNYGIYIFGSSGTTNAPYNLITENLFHSISIKAIEIDYPNETGNNAKGKYSLTITPVTTPFYGQVTGTADANDRIEVFQADATQEALEYLGFTTADGQGNWSINLNPASITRTHLAITATDEQGINGSDLENTSELFSITIPTVSLCPEPEIVVSGECTSAPAVFDLSSGMSLSGSTITWDFGDGTTVANNTLPQSHQYTSPNTYTATVNVVGPGACNYTAQKEITIICCECQTSFAPEPGKKYVVSAWVKETQPYIAGTQVEQQVQTYTGPEIYLEFADQNGGVLSTAGPFVGSRAIIEGWQQVQEEFTVPATATTMKIKLNNAGNNEVYFDDIRIHPFNSSMKSYVYDPVSLRLWSELDDRNYATFYEYDEQGNLTRIKKETERGIVTIQESREGQYKKEKNIQ